MPAPSIKIDGIEYVPATSLAPSETQVVLGGGELVFVGRVSEERDDLVLTNASRVVEYLTLGGLVEGPLDSTRLDACGTVRLPKSSVIARINTAPGAWE